MKPCDIFDDDFGLTSDVLEYLWSRNARLVDGPYSGEWKRCEPRDGQGERGQLDRCKVIDQCNRPEGGGGWWVRN